ADEESQFIFLAGRRGYLRLNPRLCAGVSGQADPLVAFLGGEGNSVDRKPESHKKNVSALPNHMPAMEFFPLSESLGLPLRNNGIFETAIANSNGSRRTEANAQQYI